MTSIFDLLPDIPLDDRVALEKMWGGDIRQSPGLGERPALLVVDMTEAFVRDEWPTGWAATGKPCADAIGRLLTAVRAAGWPVAFTRTTPLLLEAEVGAWLRGGAGPSLFPFDGPPQVHEIVPEVAPINGELVFAKPKPSAFFATQLLSMLVHLRVDSLVVTGMTTSGCVRATVNDAFMRNYRVVVPVECVADRAQLSHQVELFDMGAKYADLVRLDDLLGEVHAPG